MSPDTYSLVGLALNFVGTVMIAIFGWPQPDFTPQFDCLVTTGLSEQTRLENEQREWRRARHLQRSRAAMGAVATGFLLQALALL